MVIANDSVGTFVPGLRARGSRRPVGGLIRLAFAVRDLTASTIEW
jgi:hypothetical protein